MPHIICKVIIIRLGQQTTLKVKLGDRLEDDFLDGKLPMPHPLTSI